jgi:hypothetical protein
MERTSRMRILTSRVFVGVGALLIVGSGLQVLSYAANGMCCDETGNTTCMGCYDTKVGGLNINFVQLGSNTYSQCASGGLLQNCNNASFHCYDQGDNTKFLQPGCAAQNNNMGAFHRVIVVCADGADQCS